MAAIWAWVLRLLGGFNLASNFGEKIGKIIYVSIIAIGAVSIAWATWVTFIKPHTHWATPTHTQTGGTSYNYEIRVGMGGCARLPVICKEAK